MNGLLETHKVEMTKKSIFLISLIENLKQDKILNPLGQAWQSGSAMAT